jgi:iron(II)-dependent oxidoreductase
MLASEDIETRRLPREVQLHELVDRLADARRRSDELFALVRDEFLYQRPIAERHRIVFYIGHLETFDWNLLRERALGLEAFDPEFERLFAFGIDPVDGGLPSDQPSDWPTLVRTREYARRLRQTIDDQLANLPDSISGSRAAETGEFSLFTLLNVAIEHRLMHVETLAYMFHQLPFHQKVRQAAPSEAVSLPLTPRMLEIPAGAVILGLERGHAFGWDNEYDAHQVDVPAFSVDQFKVTNRQYLEFMAAGGYETRSFWSDDDWNWKTNGAIFHPVFWKRDGFNGGGWLLRTMFDEIPLPADWPVYVSHAEANAFARWAGKTLPTEAQWQRAAYGEAENKGNGKERAYPWGNRAPSSSLGNFDFQQWNPVLVNAFPEGQSAFGVADLMGNGWEWTSTPFAPFAGFQRFPFYPGYSADFFDGKHFVMKGASPRTAACMLRRSFRNWFQPHYQYAYAGFRCVGR